MTSKDRPSIPTTVHSTDLSAASSITTLAQSSMFWRPIFLARSDWLEHIPFAFWLIEAHKPSTVVEVGTCEGVSYFAMCQAVDRLHLDAHCYAVNTWSEETFNSDNAQDLYLSVKAHNEAYYSSFSSLVRSTSRQALEHFTDGSVDLINFVGLNGYETASQLIDSWLPKLSDRGLILIQDTNMREKGIYTHKLFKELGETYPSFEFRHGRGLGLVGVGENQTGLINALFDENGERRSNQTVQDVFSRLGRACADSFSARVSEQNTAELERNAKALKTSLETAEKNLETTHSALHEKSAEMNQLQQTKQQQFETHALERGQLVERSSMIQKQFDHLQSETETLRNNLEAATGKLSQQEKDHFRVTAEKASLEKQLNLLQEEFTAQLEATKTNSEAQLAGKNTALDELTRELELQKATVTRELNENKSVNELLLSKEQDIKQLTGKNTFLDKQNKELELETGSLSKELNEIKALNERLLTKEQDLKLLMSQTQEEFTNQLKAANTEAEAQLSEKNTTLAKLEKELKLQETTIGKHLKEVAAVTDLLESNKKSAAEKLKGKELKHTQEVTKIKENSMRDIEKAKDALAAKASSLETKSRELESQKELVADRFKETAILTTLLESKEKEHQSALESQELEYARKLEAITQEKNAQLVQLRARHANLQTEKGSKLFGQKHTKAETQMIKESGLFDSQWYLSTYQDIASDEASSKNPLQHYLLIGGFEGRNPSEDFDTIWYLVQNPDVANEGVNPLIHYLLYGKSEGRLSKPPSGKNQLL